MQLKIVAYNIFSCIKQVANYIFSFSEALNIYCPKMKMHKKIQFWHQMQERSRPKLHVQLGAWKNFQVFSIVNPLCVGILLKGTPRTSNPLSF
jgi:hypothetical protein